MTADTAWLRTHVRDIADYPEPGVTFKDITPLLSNVDAFRFAVDALADHYCGDNIDHVVGMEARGFLLGAPLAYRCGTGFIPVRKPGKLPRQTVTESYSLEYGTDQLEMHHDAVQAGDRVLIIDDVLATGGTAAATIRLVEGLGAEVAGVGFLMELAFLDGAARLDGHEVFSLLRYE